MTRPIIAPDGRVFPSISAMARAHGLTPATLQCRLMRGWPLALALDTAPGDSRRGTPARDHLGRDYLSIRAMARAWGIEVGSLYDRLDRGWCLEQALTTPSLGSTPSRDHLGRNYPNMAEMARTWGLSPHLVGIRLARGWTVERALTTPKGQSPKRVV